MAKSKEWLWRSLLLFTSTVIGLLILEIAVRFLFPAFDEFGSDHLFLHGWNETDPELIFVRKPFIQWEGKPVRDRYGHHVVYNTDENGFRNPLDVTTADIVFIGDSFTEASTMPDEDIFVRKVASKSSLSTVNLGRGSYGPQQELVVLKRYGLAYSPRAVIWQIYEGNDLRDAERYYLGDARETPRKYTNLDRHETIGKIWFDEYQLYKLRERPDGRPWQPGPTHLFSEANYVERYAASGNLVRNGGFEVGKNGLANWVSSNIPEDCDVSQVQSEIAGGGENCLEVSLPGDRELWLRQTLVGVEPGSQYLITGHIKTANLGGAAKLAVGGQRADGSTFLVRGLPVQETQDWTELGMIFTAPEDPSTLFLYLHRQTMKAPPRRERSLFRLPEIIQSINHFYRGNPSMYWGMKGVFHTNEGEDIKIGFQTPYKPDAVVEFPHGWDETRRCILEGAALCKERGIRFVVLFIPIKLRVEGPVATLTPSSDEERETWLPGGKWDQEGDFADSFKRFCEQNDVEYIDTLPDLRARAAEGHRVYAARFDSHLDIEGHAVVADIICEKLR